MVASTKPYLIRALYEWCVDNGYTPYIDVWVDDNVRVPREYVRSDQHIVLNISYTASQNLKIDNHMITFSARFGGIAREIVIPIGYVLAIFAQENGNGMGFELELSTENHTASENPSQGDSPKDKEAFKEKTKSHLRIVK